MYVWFHYDLYIMPLTKHKTENCVRHITATVVPTWFSHLLVNNSETTFLRKVEKAATEITGQRKFVVAL